MRFPITLTKDRTFRLGKLLALVLIALPIGIHLWFVHTFAVSLPFWDEWEFWWSMKGLDEGDLYYAFWIPHNEHRLVVTRIVYFLLRDTVGLDVTVAMYINVLLAMLTLWGLWLHLRSSVQASLWYLVPVAFVVFSLGQWENMLWGWQIAIYSMVCSGVWSLYWLSRPGNVQVGLAILAAIVSSLSFVNGLMIWPAGLVYLLLARRGRNRLLVWCGVGAMTYIVYFRNYVTQVTRPSPTGLVRPTSIWEFFEAPFGVLGHDLLSLPELILGNVGALLAPTNLKMASLLGAVMIVTFVIAIVLLLRAQGQWSTMPLSLVALALLSFLSSLTITGGRMGYWDAVFALSSRYTTITLLGIVATYLLVVAIVNGPQMLPPTSRYTRYISVALCGVWLLIFVLTLPAGYHVGLEKGQAWLTERTWQLEIVQQFETRSDDELSRVYPKTLRERLVYWQEHNLEPFYK